MRFVKTVENLFGLPQGFTRVEYLKTNSSRYYIDTGYKANNTTKVEIKTQGQTWTFGGRTSIAFGDALGICFNANLVALQFGSQSINYNQTGIAQQVSECVISQDGAYINGVLRASFTSETFSCPNNLYLFEINNNGSLGDGLKGKMWYCRIWDGDTLVRDFIPCIDPLGRACMYDLVGKKPYYNAGTGTFTAGRQIIPVEYLEGTGTQYIDTGVRGFADFKIGVKLRESVSNVSIFCGNGYRLERYNASNLYWRFRNNNDFYNSGISITEYHVMAWKNDEVYADGVKLQDFAKTWNVPANMTLFGASASGSYPSMIYFCKLWNPTDGTLLRDYIPCKDENDNGFLFDKVSGVCYLNNGTGNFAFGENKYKTKLRLIKDNRLPAGYTQVEYLESTGTQWIDTGIDVSIANTDVCKVVTDFIVFTPPSATVLNAYTGIFGAGSPRFGAYAIYDKICFGYVSAFDNIQSFNFGQKYNLEYTVTKGSQEAKLDGVSIWTATNTGTLTNAYKLGLFCRTQSSVQWIQNARIYNFKFYDNGTLIRDYIPALDPSGTPCMYDLVTKTPFYNQGTGTFSYGKTISMVRFIQDVIPREYAIVNYIESTGTQYIDTGIIGTEGVLSEIDVMKTTATINECFLGTWNSGSARCWLAYAFSNKWYPGYGGAASDMVPVVQNSWTHIKTYITQVSARKYFGYNVNGTDYTLTGYFTSFIGQNTILMFAMNTNTGANYKATGRIGTCKITKDGVLVRNFIPVVRRIDKVAGMWDTVTKQFFTNQGTGADFNYG